jgi:16S rRNA processing protein RimM
MAGKGRVCVGMITGAHGVRGLVKVRAFTADPAGIAAYGPVTDDRGRAHALEVLSPLKGDGWIARLPGIADREAAAALAGVRLWVDREALPQAGEEEFYHADLIGLCAILADGRPLGRVRAVHDFGAGDVLEIAREGSASVMVPFTRAAVPEVDLAAGRLVVEPPPGLIDDAGPAGGVP